MKFTDGYWQIREGVTPHYPAQAYEVTHEPGAMTVFAPTTKIVMRGDTLGAPALTIRFSAPMENVIRVKIVHHKGTLPRKPEFIIYGQPDAQADFSEDEQCAKLTSGQLSVRVQRGETWSVEYKAGETFFGFCQERTGGQHLERGWRHQQRAIL